MHYFFTSLWLQKEYLARDFIKCSENDFYTFYISKKQREILSRQGLVLFHKRFKSYEEKIRRQLKITPKFFSAVRAKNKNLRKLSNKELAKDFLKVILYCQKIGSHYFWTEYFCQDRVYQVLEKKDRRFNLAEIRKNVKKMGELKYKQRQFLNQTLYPNNILEKYYKLIGERFNLGERIKDYHYKELIALLRGKNIKIPDRTFYVKGKFSGWKDILGEKARKIISQLQKIDSSIEEIKGNIGNKGYYKGRVRKIDFSLKTDFEKEINLMKKGEVLVSGSTGPEMILACRKAGAIITDEGGITSHAALISRELGIPSVIATKIATKVLKDGDLVEVDADHGIVKIIKRG